eukprot:7995263-Pyramimonas_sp.AAC.1
MILASHQSLGALRARQHLVVLRRWEDRAEAVADHARTVANIAAHELEGAEVGAAVRADEEGRVVLDV